MGSKTANLCSMASKKRPVELAPDRTRDYAEPAPRTAATPARAARKASSEDTTVPAKRVRSADATRKGVGHDERRPPPAVLPKKAKRVDQPYVVGLAISDALFRANLARGLVRAGCHVHDVQSSADVASLIDQTQVAIVDFDGDEAPRLFAAFHDKNPALPILALSSQPEKIRRALKAVHLSPCDVLARTTAIADLLEALKRLREAAP